jgi:transcription elongation factor GreA
MPRNRHKEHDEMTDTQVTWLTQESHDRLKAELDQLIANRPVIAAEINDRREEGDLRENGGYQAAREEQAKEEGRIAQLQALLREAKVGEAPVTDGEAGPGMLVTVRFDGDNEDETFLIGSREESETAGVEVYSAASPLGVALTGAREGDTVEYETPNGKTMKVTLINTRPFGG